MWDERIAKERIGENISKTLLSVSSEVLLFHRLIGSSSSLVSYKRQEIERETGIPFLIVTDTTLSLFFVVASRVVRLQIGTQRRYYIA